MLKYKFNKKIIEPKKVNQTLSSASRWIPWNCRCLCHLPLSLSPSLTQSLSLSPSLSLSLSLPLSVRLLSIRDRFLFFAVKRICWHESMSTYFSLSSCACLFLCLGDTCLCLGSPFPSLCEYIYMSPTALVRTVTCKWQRKYYCCQRVTRAFVFVLTRECCNFNTWLVIF